MELSSLIFHELKMKKFQSVRKMKKKKPTRKMFLIPQEMELSSPRKFNKTS